VLRGLREDVATTRWPKIRLGRRGDRTRRGGADPGGARPQVAETDETVAAVRGPLAARTAARLGPVYDVHRLGIFFTASPRHADVLLVTGAGSDGMVAPQRATYATCRIPRS